jgi:hypothetical protein
VSTSATRQGAAGSGVVQRARVQIAAPAGTRVPWRCSSPW